MTYGDLLPQIKFEADMDASTDFDEYILNLLNEIGKETVKKFDLIEFLVAGATLNLVAQTKSIPLPSDWCRQAGKRVYYNTSGDQNYTQELTPLRLRYNRSNLGGGTRFFQVTGNVISLMPFDSINLGDTITLDYYRKPDMLVDEASEISEALENVLRHGTLARLMNYKDSKRAAQYMDSYRSALTALAGNGTIN